MGFRSGPEWTEIASHTHALQVPGGCLVWVQDSGTFAPAITFVPHVELDPRASTVYPQARLVAPSRRTMVTVALDLLDACGSDSLTEVEAIQTRPATFTRASASTDSARST